MNIPRSAGPTVRRYQWISVALLLMVGIINILDRATLGVANVNISKDLGLNPTQMGDLAAAFSLAYAFTQLPLGVLLDRVAARVALGAGLFFWSAAQLCGGFITSLHQFIGTRVALGIGESPTFPAGAKFLADWFNKRERGAPTGIFLSSSTISPMIAPPLLTALMLWVGWRQMFIVMGVAGIVLSIIWYLVARDRKSVALSPEEGAYFDDGHHAGAFQRTMTFHEWRGLFAQPTMWGIVLGFFGTIYCVYLYQTWLFAYLHNERHLTFEKTGWVAAIPYFFGMLGSLFSGFFADFLLRRGVQPINTRKWPLCLGMLGYAVFAPAMAYTQNNALALVFLCCLMFFMYITSSGAWALVNFATPRHMIATVGGIQNFGGYFGGTLAASISGRLVQSTHSYQSSFVVSAIIAFVAACLYFVLVRAPIRDADHAVKA